MSNWPLLIPVRKHRPLPGRFSWPARTTVFRQADDALPAEQLGADLAALRVHAEPAGQAEGATIRALRDKSIASAEGYRLAVKPGGVELRASTAAGIYYAFQTLRDLVEHYGRRLPCLVIDDQPDFARRGFYHDISRDKVPSVNTLQQLIPRLARWKINEFQLYIENVFHFPSHPDIGRGYSPLTADDIRLVQDTCRQHHVRLVGSLASFGHLERVLKLRAYKHLAELPGKGEMGHLGTICPSDPQSLALIRDLYADLVPLFDAVDFNICGDETWDLGKGRSKRRADRIGVGRLYLEWILKLHRLCQKHGKRMNMWADIALQHPEILPLLPRDIVMLNWDYEPGGSRMRRAGEIAAAGLPQVICPGTHGWQSHGTRLQTAMDNVKQFAARGRRHGCEGLLNTDWGDFGHRNFLGVSLHGFAHGAAHAWCGRKVDEKTFTRRFARAVFGDRDGRLAAAIQTLGDCPTYCLYHCLAETLDPLKGPRPRRGIAQADPALVADRAEQMRALRLPRVDKLGTIAGVAENAPSALPDFERLALEEFDLARRMEELACRRALAGLDYRAGKSLARGCLLEQASDLSQIMEELAALWQARNRASRLADNLTLLRRAMTEALRLGGKPLATKTRIRPPLLARG